MKQPKVFLIIMDGWGYSPIKEGNAILKANKPNFDYLWRNYPHTLLSASGEEVGLPWGELGGSEVGHLTIGSGRIVYQNLPRITKSISDGTFFDNNYLNSAIDNAQKNSTNLHIIGLISSGGVHSHINHLEALLKLVKKRNFKGNCYIHMITDGRDTPPTSAPMFVKKTKEIISDLRINAQIASVTGRYYSMDRDHHWDRTILAYNAIVKGEGLNANSPEEAIKQAYDRKETDEFIKPTLINLSSSQNNQGLINKLFSKKENTAQNTNQENIVAIKEKDSLIFLNFRPDRMRQIVELFLFPRQDMPDKITLKGLSIVTMATYNESMPLNAAFPLEHIQTTMADLISEAGLSQLHIAETEKYAHVTYFLNGGKPEPHENEKWQLIPSPKVATFDLQPEMSAAGITDFIIEENKKTPYDFIMINFANCDLVGHTGNFDATVKACETVDEQLGRLVNEFPESYFVIAADHGNAEQKINPQTSEKSTSHTLNPVPCIIAHPNLKLSRPQNDIEHAEGMLADLAPTVLNLLGLKPSSEMTGYNLLKSIIPNPETLKTK